MKHLYKVLFVILLFSLFPKEVFLQGTDFERYFPEINITFSNGPSPGYFFLATKKTYVDTAKNYVAIIDNYGTPLYFRLADKSAAGLQVRPNGIYLNEGTPKKYYRLDSMLMKADTFTTQGYKLDGHDLDIDENGHFLLLGNDPQTVDLTALGGVADATVKDKVVQEFDKNGNLLYTWKGLDHFEVTDANEDSPYVDYTASTVDYLHANSLTFDSDTSFLLSCRHFDEITKIDRRTGEIIWRLGGEHNQFTFVNDTLMFSHPHTIRKLVNGNILLFDNGNLHNPPFTSVVEYQLDEQLFTATLVRRQYHVPDIFADHGGGQMMLDNGNLLVYWGEETPSFTEYHPDGSVAIEMDFSSHTFSNRIGKSTWRHKVFEITTDTVNYGMWDGYTESNYLLTVKNNTDSVFTLTGYHTMTSYFYIQDQFPVAIPSNGQVTLTVTYFPETAETGFIRDILTLQADYPHLYLGQQVVLLGKKEDTQSPEVVISPDTANVPRDAVIHADFSEPVRLNSSTELDYQNVDTIFVLRENDASGQDIAFDAVISTDKMHVFIKPDDSLGIDQTYYVAMKDPLEDYSGNGLTPVEVTFSTGATILYKRTRTAIDFTVYPNPGSGIFTVHFQGNDFRKIEVYTITGKRIYRAVNVTSDTYLLDLTGNKPGMYLLHVSGTAEQGSQIKKIMLLSR